MFLVLLSRVFAWLFSGGKKNMWSDFFFSSEHCPTIQNLQTPKSDIVDGSGGVTERATVPQASLTVVNLPPFPCLCNAHEFLNKVASL